MFSESSEREDRENRAIIESIHHVKLSTSKKTLEKTKDKDPVANFLMPDYSLLGGEPYREKKIYRSGIDKGIESFLGKPTAKFLAYYVDYYIFSLPEYYKERHMHYDFYDTLDKRVKIIKKEINDSGETLTPKDLNALVIQKIKNKITSKIVSKSIQDIVLFSSIVFMLGAYIPAISYITSMLSLAIVVLGPVAAFGSILYNRKKIDGNFNILEPRSFLKDLISAFKKGKILKIIARKLNSIAKIPVINIIFPQLMSLFSAIYSEFIDNSGFRALANKRALWLGPCCITFAKLSFMPVVSTAELKKASDKGKDKRSCIIEKLEKELKDAKVANNDESIKKYFKNKTVEKIYNKLQRNYASTYFKTISIITAILLIAMPISPAYIAIGSAAIQFASWGFSFVYASRQKGIIRAAVTKVFEFSEIKEQLKVIKEEVLDNNAHALQGKNNHYLPGQKIAPSLKSSILKVHGAEALDIKKLERIKVSLDKKHVVYKVSVDKKSVSFGSGLQDKFLFVDPALEFAKSEQESGKKIELIPSADNEAGLVRLLQELYKKDDEGLKIAALKINGERLGKDDFDRIIKHAIKLKNKRASI